MITARRGFGKQRGEERESGGPLNEHDCSKKKDDPAVALFLLYCSMSRTGIEPVTR
jgi:hypothetical protein